VRPPGGAKFIAYERLEEVEGASVEERGSLLGLAMHGPLATAAMAIAVCTSLSQVVVATATGLSSSVGRTSMKMAARSIHTKKRRKPTRR
jgi:hypothetical protein